MAGLIGSVAVIAALTACTTPTDATEGTDLSAALVSTPAIATAGTLSVCVSASNGNPPNYFVDESNEVQGLEVEMAQYVADYLGLQYRAHDVPFASIIPSLQAAQCDVIMSSLYIKPERAEVVDFVPYLSQSTAIGVRKGNPDDITGLDDSVCGLNVGAQTGTTANLTAVTVSEACVAAGKPAVLISETDAATTSAQLLISGQIDVWAATSPGIDYYHQQSDEGFDLAGEPIGVVNVGAGTLKGNDELHAAIDDAFTEMRADGSYDAFLQQWGQERAAYIAE